jgi:Lysozyme like domain
MTTPGPKVKTPVGDAPVVPVILLAAGMELCWFAIHYWGSDTPWPTDPIKAVLQGRAIPVPQRTDTPGQVAAVTAAQTAAANAQLAAQAGGVTPGTGQANPNAVGQAVAAGAGTGDTYDHAQLVALWQQAGGSSGTANNAACHALQESGGRPGVTSANPDGGTNVGLWQLDTKGVGSGYTIAQLQDPLTNARLTVMHTGNGTNWSQWATAGCP